jgi:hypothetical protein
MGVWPTSGTSYPGGGDDPYFIQKMHDWITNPANNVAYHSYFELASDADHQLDGDSEPVSASMPTIFPQSSALFQRVFRVFNFTAGEATVANRSVIIKTSITSAQTVNYVIVKVVCTDADGHLAGSGF